MSVVNEKKVLGADVELKVGLTIDILTGKGLPFIIKAEI